MVVVMVVRWESTKREKKRECSESVSQSVFGGEGKNKRRKESVSGGNISVGLALVENFRIGITITVIVTCRKSPSRLMYRAYYDTQKGVMITAVLYIVCN